MNSEFASVVEGSRGRLLMPVRNIVGDNALAEDIVQDTVRAGLQTVNEGKRASCPEAWLMKAVRKKALYAVRSACSSLPMEPPA